jgi:hypothetical protein
MEAGTLLQREPLGEFLDRIVGKDTETCIDMNIIK